MSERIEERSAEAERVARWRLLLGKNSALDDAAALGGRERRMDAALEGLYRNDDETRRAGGLQQSAPNVARWLGEIREFFPRSVVQVMQKDAIDRLGLRQLLLEPEVLATVERDVHLLATLIALKDAVPAKAKAMARQIVGEVVRELMRRVGDATRQAVSGALRRSCRTNRPRHAEIDWHRTIRANLRHYQAEYGTIVPERRIGYGRKRSAVRTVILCIDQSGSMAQSVVYAGIFGAVLASMPSLATHVIAFDTNVVDLSDHLSDPVDLLFGVQLGGGTDIAPALACCATKVVRPRDTILVLISDLFDGGREAETIRTAHALVAAGVRVIVLLALDDNGRPAFSHSLASSLAAIGIPSFACTPDRFPDLMAAAIDGRDLGAWADAEGITTTPRGA